MQEYKIPITNTETILALGAESSGNFSVLINGTMYVSEDFGDLLEDSNFQIYTDTLYDFLRKGKIKPTIILSDLHPDFRTTQLAKKLAKKYNAQHAKVQHHLAHIFSAIGDRMLHDSCFMIHDSCIGVACDGTGYGFDEKIWGGEIFAITNNQFPISKKNTDSKLQIARIGHLENQVLIGGQKAIEEPARLIISIINKFPISNFQFPNKSQFSNVNNSKQLAYELTRKYYSKNEFELLWNQLQQNFNCIETSSTARILDAVSVLLGFSSNERKEKHGPVNLLEKNSTTAYSLKPRIEIIKIQNTKYKILNTTYLFEYLIKNINKDRHRLAATAQKYIADGLLEIIKNCHPEQSEESNKLEARSYNLEAVFFAGGMANNKIISSTLQEQGVYVNKKIPRGDGGISFGQVFYFILANSRD